MQACMYASIGSGPSRRMRARSLRSSALSLPPASGGSIAGRRTALVRSPHHIEANEDHGQRIENPGGEGAEGQPMFGVGLAEQLAERAGQPVAAQESAAGIARPPQRQLRMR